MKVIVLSDGSIGAAVCIALAIHKYGKDNVSLITLSCDAKTHIKYRRSENLAKSYEIEYYIIEDTPYSKSLLLSSVANYIKLLREGKYIIYYGGTDSGDFIYNMNIALNIEYKGQIKVLAPLTGSSLEEIIELGNMFKIPFELTWSCKRSDVKPCGQCIDCKEREKAFKRNGLIDPIK